MAKISSGGVSHEPGEAPEGWPEGTAVGPGRDLSPHEPVTGFVRSHPINIPNVATTEASDTDGGHGPESVSPVTRVRDDDADRARVADDDEPVDPGPDDGTDRSVHGSEAVVPQPQADDVEPDVEPGTGEPPVLPAAEPAPGREASPDVPAIAEPSRESPPPHDGHDAASSAAPLPEGEAPVIRADEPVRITPASEHETAPPARDPGTGRFSSGAPQSNRI